MARQRKCRDCKKELTGKYYIISGTGGFEASRANFCSSCCDKKRKIPSIKRKIEEGEVKVVEKEAGDKLMDEISDFEDKWEKHNNLDISKVSLPDNKTLLNSIQKACQELEPYLQKPEIVEKAWGREYDSEEFGVELKMEFFYLFTKSARDKDYKQKVVQPTIEEILGGKLDKEINTTTTSSADGEFKVNGKLVGRYNWIDHTHECRRLCLNFLNDNKMVLKTYLRALKIKEKELQGDNSPTQPEKDNSKNPEKNNNIEPDRKIIKQYFLSNDFRFVQLNDDNSLMTLYYENKSSKKTPKHKNKSEWTTEEKHIESYLKKQNKKFLTRTEINNWTDVETSNQPKTSSNSTSWSLIIGFFIIGIIFLGGLIIFLRAKKRKQKKKK